MPFLSPALLSCCATLILRQASASLPRPPHHFVSVSFPYFTPPSSLLISTPPTSFYILQTSFNTPQTSCFSFFSPPHLTPLFILLISRPSPPSSFYLTLLLCHFTSTSSLLFSTSSSPFSFHLTLVISPQPHLASFQLPLLPSHFTSPFSLLI